MIRSLLEGATFAMRDSLELIREMGVAIEQVRLSGGGARNALWKQIQADIYGCDVHTLNSTEGPAFGVALLAQVGTGGFKSVPEACDATIRPSMRRVSTPAPRRITIVLSRFIASFIATCAGRSRRSARWWPIMPSRDRCLRHGLLAPVVQSTERYVIAAMSEENRLWYKDAVIYEVHVRAFFDSVGEGHGDFPGLTQKLDYLLDLGITAIWLLPFYPSPLKDDGYDIAAYTSIHPQYGTLDDFKALLDAAHERGLRVITELVLNHTSDQHPWFQRARHAPSGSPERDFYVWSDSARNTRTPG